MQSSFLYDIFHNGDTLVVVCPSEIVPPPTIQLSGKDQRFEVAVCPHRHTYIYTLAIPYQPTVSLQVGESVLIDLPVNRYPAFKGEILMSTLLKDEDDYVVQWIEYHRRLGVDRFILYDNAENGTLEKKVESYIREGTVLLIKWLYPLYLPVSGRSGQTTQQNHSIYAFPDAKYIGLFDVDEYVNPQMGFRRIDDLLENILSCLEFDYNNIGAFRLLSKHFVCPTTDESGYKFLETYTCGPLLTTSYEKNFVIPRNVRTFSVHTITLGKHIYTISERLMRFNHYIFLNKPDRGRNGTICENDRTITRHLSFVKRIE